LSKKIQASQENEPTVHVHTNEDLVRAFLEHIPARVYFKDLQSRFIRISRSQAEQFGFSNPDDAIGKTDFDLFSEEHAKQAFADEQEIIGTGVPLVNVEEKETWPDGRDTWALTTKLPMRDVAGNILGTMGISQDITERKRAEEELREYREGLENLIARRTGELVRVNLQLERDIAARKVAESALAQKAAELARSNQILKDISLTDDLTGLHNRKGFLALSEHRVKLAIRNEEPFAVAFVDLDDLKGINDTLGHLEGDRALRDTAGLLRDCFRESDIIARLGGDEFAIFVGEADEAHIAGRIREALASFNSEAKREYWLSFSTGIVISQNSREADIETLLKRADELMYEQKRKSRSSRRRQSEARKKTGTTNSAG
jgi:diguanylate cyclase (GGDEF)-like protein/PAS domain S-box-containing protein